MSILKQKTIKNTIMLSGVGLHSGRKVNLKLVPQRPNIGIYFKRTDLSFDNLIYPSVFLSFRECFISQLNIKEN